MNATLMPYNDDAQASEIDRHFGRFIARLAGQGDAVLLAAATLASRATGNGDVCVQLADYAGKPLAEIGCAAPPVEEWIAKHR